MMMTTPPPRKVIEIETTPNPNALKFNLNGQISAETRSFLRAEDADGVDELAKALFAIPGVTGVMFCQDFVTVNKQTEIKWGGVKTKVIRLLEAGAQDNLPETSKMS